jgi:hypothetical protein
MLLHAACRFSIDSNCRQRLLQKLHNGRSGEVQWRDLTTLAQHDAA